MMGYQVEKSLHESTKRGINEGFRSANMVVDCSVVMNGHTVL
jgi:hypothetical protein